MVTEQDVNVTILGNVKISNNITEKLGSYGEERSSKSVLRAPSFTTESKMTSSKKQKYFKM